MIAGHVIPAEGLELDRRGPGRTNGAGIATAALQLADLAGDDGPVDLVLLAVPAGRGLAELAELERLQRRA